jgi:hypothetical protein
MNILVAGSLSLSAGNHAGKPVPGAQINKFAILLSVSIHAQHEEEILRAALSADG